MTVICFGWNHALLLTSRKLALRFELRKAAMGAARKIQAEIDRTLKRVQEGIDIFDEIWDKVAFLALSTGRNAVAAEQHLHISRM